MACLVSKNILIAGATGFVGRALVNALKSQGHNIYYLTRDKHNNSLDSIYWNLEDFHLDTIKLQSINKTNKINTVINLTGENISSGYWTQTKKQRIINTRIQSSQLIIKALTECNIKINTWLNASGIGYYGNTGDIINTEESPLGKTFLAEVCKQWEQSALAAQEISSRVIIFRFGVVLDSTGSMLKKILPLFKLGLGSQLGISGQQYMSWIALEDLIKLIVYSLEKDHIQGIYNATAPESITNKKFTKILAQLLNKPVFLPVPGFVLKIILGDLAQELLLDSTRASASKIIDAGFKFKYNTLDEYLSNIKL